MSFLLRISWTRLLRYAIGSQLIAYPAALVFYTLYRVTGAEAVFQLSLLVYPLTYFFFGLRFFRGSSADDWDTHAVAAVVWAAVGYGMAVLLYVPVYAAPLSDQFQNGILAGHGVNAVVLLIAGFFSRSKRPSEPALK